jgi:methyl-accepting chemotaxis protein
MTEGQITRPSTTRVSAQERSKDIFPDPVPMIKQNSSRDDPYQRSFMGATSFATRHSLFMVLGLVAICSMAVLFHRADQMLSNSLHQAQTASNLSSLVSRIESAIVALNSDSRNFISSNDSRYAANYGERSNALARDLNLLVKNPAALDSQKVAITLDDGVVQHASQFSKIVKIRTLLGFDKDFGLKGNVETSLAALDKGLGYHTASFKDGEVSRQLSNIKMNRLQLKEDPTPQKLQQIQIDISLLNKSLTSSSLLDTEKKNLLNLLQSHRGDITQLARTLITYTKATAELDEISTYIAPSINSLMEYTNDFSETTRQKSKENQTLLRKILAGGSGGILIILIFFHWLLMKSISRPTARISEIATELARGNLGAPVPYLGNFDETGELSKALTIFRENMLQADRLRKDLEVALKDKAQQAAIPIPELEPTGDVETALPGRDLTQNSRDLTSVIEAKKFSPLEDRGQTPVRLPIGKSAITEISHQLTSTSRQASDAAEEAERTEIMVTGLDEAADKIEDIEILMIGISDQMSLLAVQTALLESESREDENLIHLDKKLDRKKSTTKAGSGQSVNDRIETIQGGTKRAIKAVQTIGTTIDAINEIAKEFSTTASKEALEAANELLRQSENLRTMLDNLLDKVDTGSSQPKDK